MSNKSTNSWPTARVHIGGSAAPPLRLAANDDLVWDQNLFNQRVRELGTVGAISLLQSLQKYLENIIMALENEMMDETSFGIIRTDLSPISVFLGFSNLTALLLNHNLSAQNNKRKLIDSVKAVAGECRNYCG